MAYDPNLAERCDSQTLRGEQDDRDAQRIERRKRKLRDHTISGAITFFVMQLLWGLLSAGSVWTAIVGAVILAIPGAIVGFVISLRFYGRVGGAILGMITVGLLVWVAGTAVNPLFALATGAWVGGVPGVLIGIHVEMDT